MTDAFEPELRAGPPWVMEDMIEAERGLPELIAAGGGAPAFARRVAEAAGAGAPILVCGCGTSEHAARGIAAVLRESVPGVSVGAADAFEVALDPPASGLVIGISHEGETAATLAATRGAAERGAGAVLITARPQHAPAGVEAVATPLHDKSWCHTVAYLSPLLTCALGAGLGAEAAAALVADGLNGSGREAARTGAAALAGCRRLLAVGSGVDEITASELALKIEEATHVPCTPLGAEKVLHGHLPAADRGTGLVLLRFDGSHAAERDARADDVTAAARVLEMPVVRLGAPGLAGAAEALIAGAVALQLLTLELSMALGVNPDLIRREEPLYRRVAEAAGAG